MSETAPERTGGGNRLTQKLGPFPVYVWLLIVLGLAIAFYFYRKNQANSQASQAAATNNSPGGVDSSLVPQFINQTYVENNPPPAPPTVGPIIRTPGPRPKKKPERLTRTWTAIGADSTMEQVAARLGQFENGKSTGDPSKLTPANSIAKNFMKNVYPKNHKAKIPKGAEFTYEEGVVTGG